MRSGGSGLIAWPPEDILLLKLQWCQLGQGILDRQWIDLVNMIKVQGESLDRDCLERWARTLDVGDLHAKAWSELEGFGQ